MFADEPRLGNAASQRWWCQIWSSATGFSSNSAGAPAQPSSSRRIHTHDSSRMPSSMPLTQWTPRSGGLASHHDRRCAAARSAYRSFPVSAYAAASTVRYWCRDGSQICLMSPTASSSRYGTSKAWSSGARRPVFGSNCQSGSAMSSRTTPKNSARPDISRSASATRRFTASGSTAASAPSGSTAVNRTPVTGGRSGSADRRRRRLHRVDGPAATSRGPIRDSRRRYHPALMLIAPPPG